MASRATWAGHVSLGLVNVPVSLYTAVTDAGVSFRQVCPTHECVTEQRVFCRDGGEQLDRDELVKGYEVEAGRLVIVTAADLERAGSPLGKTLDIEVCVPESSLDFRFFDTPYIAVPPKKDPGGLYALLRDALAATGHVGIGRIMLRTKQQIAAVRVLGQFLAVQLMRWPDEVKALDEFVAPRAAAKPAELALATKLIEGYVGTFDAETFVDQHRANVMKLIRARTRNEPEVEFTAQVEPKAAASDVLAILQASVAAAGSRKAA